MLDCNLGVEDTEREAAGRSGPYSRLQRRPVHWMVLDSDLTLVMPTRLAMLGPLLGWRLPVTTGPPRPFILRFLPKISLANSASLRRWRSTRY